MNRGRVAVCTLSLVLCAGMARARAATCDRLVVGSGDPLVDVPALQSALDGPHAVDRVTVCIAGTLAFASAPPNANVQIRSAHVDPTIPMAEVALVGVDASATIRGGFNAILVPPLRAPGGPLNDVRAIRIAGFRIQDATSSAIVAFRVNGSLEIADLHVDRVKSGQIIIAGVAYASRIGINVSAFPAIADSHITGTLTIRRSRFTAGPYAAGVGLDAATIAPVGIGVLGFPLRSIAAQVLVEDNVVEGWSGDGIAVLFTGHAEVRGNRITTGTFANDIGLLPAPPPSPCVAGNNLGSAGGIVVAGPGNVLVEDNAIDLLPSLTGAGVPPACAAGVLLVQASGAVVRDTHVRAHGAPTARGLVVHGGSGDAFADVRVDDAAVGISVSGAADVSFHDIRVDGTPLCHEVTGSTGIELVDIRC